MSKVTPDIERVARAIHASTRSEQSFDQLPYRASYTNDDVRQGKGQNKSATKDDYYDAARVAIKAMENVSTQALTAVPGAYGVEALYGTVEGSAMAWDWLQGHRAMIKAALGEDE